MDRMKTFLKYLSLLVSFFVLSVILEYDLIMGMYGEITGNINNTANSNYEIQIDDAKAARFNGYIRFKVKNVTGHFIEKCYAKIDLYSKYDLLAATKYAEINNFKENEERKFELKFKANEISRYNIEIVESMPDKTNILNLFGWEIDLSNVFGMDLTKLFGVNIAEFFNLQNMKEKGLSIFNWIKIFLASIPAWAYFIAGGIVIWNLPKGFLFGIFPI